VLWVSPHDVVDAWQKEVKSLQHVLFVFLLQHQSCTEGNCASSASSSDGDSILVDAILIWVGIEFFDDNIGILRLCWILGKWSISVVDKEVNSIGVECGILEAIRIIKSSSADVTTTMV